MNSTPVWIMAVVACQMAGGIANASDNLNGIDIVNDKLVFMYDDQTIEMTALEYGIWMTETNGRVGQIMGDNGKSRGPLQIGEAAWKDAMEFDDSIGGTYADVDGIDYSLRIFRAYKLRYATERRLGQKPTGQQIARMWNGGPTGHRKAATIGYWKKVRSHINALQTQSAIE